MRFSRLNFAHQTLRTTPHIHVHAVSRKFFFASSTGCGSTSTTFAFFDACPVSVLENLSETGIVVVTLRQSPLRSGVSNYGSEMRPKSTRF